MFTTGEWRVFINISCEAVRQKRKPELVVRKVLWTRKGVRAAVVTAGHCMHTELTSGHALASCYSCCMHSVPCLC